MGRSGNPAKRAAATKDRRNARNLIDVSVDTTRGLVVLDVGGQLTGMTPETTDALVTSLLNAAAEARAASG